MLRRVVSSVHSSGKPRQYFATATASWAIFQGNISRSVSQMLDQRVPNCLLVCATFIAALHQWHQDTRPRSLRGFTGCWLSSNAESTWRGVCDSFLRGILLIALCEFLPSSCIGIAALAAITAASTKVRTHISLVTKESPSPRGREILRFGERSTPALIRGGRWPEPRGARHKALEIETLEMAVCAECKRKSRNTPAGCRIAVMVST